MSNVLNFQNVGSALELLSQVTSQFIVRPTGGVGSIGISGYLFDITAQEESDIDSEITDHYVEDNTSIQDHIALRPRKFMMRGYVSELNNSVPEALAQVFSAVQSIALVANLVPKFTAQATQTYSSIQSALLNSALMVSEAKSLYGIFVQSNTTATRQQSAYNYLMSLWSSRQLCDVETPYGVIQKMAIESLRVSQREESSTFSEFQITFKEIRIVSDAVSTQISSSLGRVANIYSAPAINGNAQGQEVSAAQLNIDFGSKG